MSLYSSTALFPYSHVVPTSALLRLFSHMDTRLSSPTSRLFTPVVGREGARLSYISSPPASTQSLASSGCSCGYPPQHIHELTWLRRDLFTTTPRHTECLMHTCAALDLWLPT